MRNTAAGKLLGQNKKAVAINTVLIANAFIWYSYAFKFLTNSITTLQLDNQFLTILSIHFAVLFIALLIGVFFSQRSENKIKFLVTWMGIGALLSLVPLITGLTPIGLMIFAVIAGFNFGFGLPTCLAYFASTTLASNRGKLGGIIYLLIGVGAFIISVGGTESLIVVTLILAGWKALGLLSIKLLKPQEKAEAPNQTQSQSYRTIISNRGFLLYFIPWIMFVFVNSLAFPVIDSQFSAELVQTSTNVEYVLSGVCALIFGFLADSKGRKRLTVAGFAFLGLGYGVLGFSSGSMLGWWFYTIIDGIAWGCFVMVFIFALWGDIAEGKRSEKIYAIGLLPYLLSSFIRFLMGSSLANYVVEQGQGLATVFSFFSFFLFIAVMPLVLAPETMSEATLKSNELKNYVEKAKRQVMKNQNKKDAQQPKQEVAYFQENQTSQEESDEYKKAKELAEKYY
jgi:MFS family permease